MALIAAAGVFQAVAGWLAVRRFAGLPAPAPGWRQEMGARPPMTVLKPLYGDEPLLEQALASLCALDYPGLQIVFGVQSQADAALAVVARLRARFPDRDIAVVVDPAVHGSNHKIGNLINMFASAKHDILVIADSDVHCTPDYLDAIAATLAIPGTGLATTLYAGRVARPGLVSALGAVWINASFLPGAVMARSLGRQDCLGATMALRRETLTAIGGLRALVDHLADDHMLGKLVQQLGLAVRLAPTLVATTVPETGFATLYRHELRWSRTILSLVPAAFAMSAIQYPIFWAGLAMALSGGALWTVMLFALAWIARAGAAWGIDARLGLARSGLATSAPFWLFPLRDVLSMVVFLASYRSDDVEWRGQHLTTGRHATFADTQPVPHSGASAPQGSM
jgi:ceramide glucosyltransferase